MDMTTFWRLIDDTRYASGGDSRKHNELVIEALAAMPIEEMVAFEGIYTHLLRHAYDRHLWNAAYIIGCGCTDDGFTDFRGWLIGQGEEIYQNALKDPDSLADLVEIGVDTQFGVDWGVVLEAYERKTGEEMPLSILSPGEKAVLKNNDAVPRHKMTTAEWEQISKEKFPKLFAKFGDCPGWNDFLNQSTSEA